MNQYETCALALAYFLGSIPFGLIFSKLAGYGDIRAKGSGNIGATNVLRNTNKTIAALTLFCDFAKGVVALLLVYYLCKDQTFSAYAGAAAVIGHIFPVWLGFRGGKGVATAMGVFLALDWQIGLVTVLAWVLGFAMTRISGAAALIAFCVTPLVTWFFVFDPQTEYVVMLISLLVLIRHYSNMKQLLRK